MNGPDYKKIMLSSFLKNKMKIGDTAIGAKILTGIPKEPEKKMKEDLDEISEKIDLKEKTNKATGEVTDLLESAVKKATVPDKKFNFYLQGDLCQMGSQKSFLKKNGFIVEQSDVYPVLNEADVPKALTLLFENKIEGWWHYKKELSELGITSEEPSNPNVPLGTQAAMLKFQYNTEEVKKEKVVLNKKKVATPFNRRVKW